MALYIDLDSPADLDALKALVGIASRACYVEALLALPVRHKLRRGDDWIDMDEPRTEPAA